LFLGFVGLEVFEGGKSKGEGGLKTPNGQPSPLKPMCGKKTKRKKEGKPYMGEDKKNEQGVVWR
jgi:hypothetical protein